MTFREIWQTLTPMYDDAEAKAIVRTVLEDKWGFTLTDIYSGKVTQLSEENQSLLAKITHRLRQGEPVQYVLGTALFGGRHFHVEPGMLIPRPETYTLCQWVSRFLQATTNTSGQGKWLLDVCTGSGCIVITLALDNCLSRAMGSDISERALAIARRNADELHAKVTFRQADALNAASLARQEEGAWDVIVSNPPYICLKEQSEMMPNVLQYEPHEALFVPDNDPLRFYRAISDYAFRALNPGGALFFETNPLYITDVADMLNKMGFSTVELKEDDYGKTRFTKAIRP